MTYILTRVQVGDYEAWKPIFDSDPPGARRAAKSHRLLRSAEDPNEVYVSVEFDSPEAAHEARERLLASGILERFPDHTGPTVAEVAESVTY
jgi:hypothetical protein